MSYVDGFVVPVPKAKLDEYRRLATLARDVWKEHGALDYHEHIADDVPAGELTSFPRGVQLKDDEVVIFAWILFRSREHRDEVNKKALADPRIEHKPESCPFDPKRMIWGGFASFVE